MIPDTGSGRISAAVHDEMARLYDDHALALCRYGLLLAGSREAAQDAVHEGSTPTTGAGPRSHTS